MIELNLLGPHAVRGSDGRDIGTLPAQPKRFAVLAYLAIESRDGYHRRDTIATMFWPGLDQFGARRALRNTLYHLREALGEGIIVSQGDEAVGIDAARLITDVAKLQAALNADRFEEALDYYKGELLAGMHFANADAAFEEWLARERMRTSDLAMRAVRGLTDLEEKAGNIPAAAHWAQRAIALAPGDENWVCRAMALLDAANDRAGALRLFENHTRRLAAEFDAAPSGKTVALAAHIRAGERSIHESPARSAALPLVSVAPLSDITSHAAAVAGHAASHQGNSGATGGALPDTPAAAAIASPPAAPPWRRRRTAGWIVGLFALALCLVMAFRLTNSSAQVKTVRGRVLIAVFDNRTGDDRFQSLGRMTQDWLTQGVLRTGVIDVVDQRVVFVQRRTAAGAAADPLDIAHRNGATLLVSGSYYRARDSLIFEASLIETGTGRVIRAIGPIVAPASEPVAALDALRGRVMTALALAVNEQVPIQDDLSAEIPPYEAYQSYVEGWDAFWHGDGPRSERAFLDAAHRDTLFGAAAVAAAMSASNFNHCTLIDSISNVLAARAVPLERIDQLSMQIAVARCQGQNDEMLRLTLERAELEPRTSSFRMPAAAAALWADRPAKALGILEHINPAVDLGWSTDTTHFSYFSSITEALHLLGRYDDELAIANRVSDAAPLTRAWLRGRALAARSRSADLLALVDSALTLPAETSLSIGLAPFSNGRPQYSGTAGWVAAWIARELASHGNSTTSRLVALRGIAWYRGRPPDERATPEERLAAAWSLELSGDFAESERFARKLVQEDSTNVDYRGLLAGLAVRTSKLALADSLDRWLAAQTDDRVSWSASFYRARDAALLGHNDDALARIRESLGRGAWPLWLHLEPAFVPLRTRADFVALTAPR